MYKVVFIDWDDTLGDWSHAALRAAHDIYKQFEIGRWFESFQQWFDLYESHNQHLWEQYGRSEIGKEKLKLDRFLWPLMQAGGTKELMGLAHEMGEEFIRLTNSYFHLLPDAEEVVKYLAEKYPVTVLSNGFREAQDYKFKHSGLLPYLTHTLISEDFGVNKPNPRLYEIALEKHGVTADEAIMIGDSYTSDIVGAKAVKMDQIWIADPDKCKKEGRTATHIVPKLTDVMSIL